MEKPRSERKKKKTKGKRKSEDDNIRKYKEIITHKFDVSGVKKLELSPGTQRAIGCVVGEHVTRDEPWIYIKKERFEDNLELHEASSEFLPFRQEILEYPEENLFVGYDTSVIEGPTQFLICVTKDGKNTILNTLEEEKRKLDERLRNCLRRPVGKWNSLGSETEVMESIVQSMRPLTEIEMETAYPLSNVSTKFSLRPVTGAVDGYVELLPGRFSFENIFRKRVDAAVQIAPEKTTNEAQTTPTYPTNIWTEYKYEYEEEKLTPAINKKLGKFVFDVTKPLYNMLEINAHIDFYLNDYGSLKRKRNQFTTIDNREEIAFQDVVTCKRKLVACLSWHPLLSGIIAVAYRRTTQTSLQSEPSTEDDVNNTVYGENHILIWSYEDTLKPKLYLLAPREVNYVSFCPHDGNILIGGCTNGQIAIWDNIDKKLEEIETMEILTQAQESHRLILEAQMTWMQNTEDVAVVIPTVISAIDYSSKACISAIKWLPIDNIITRNGKIECLYDCDNWNKQFITCSLDGTMLLWDLEEELAKAEQTRRPGKKSKRLKERPSALTRDVSKFKIIDKIFQPKFKFIIEDPDSKRPLPLANIDIEKQILSYVPVNEHSLLDLLKRTKFTVKRSDCDVKFEPKFGITSITGRFLNCSWEGHEFDQGKRINEEVCDAEAYISIHDGPIKTILRSPFLDSVVLTVGGRVFAIWDVKIGKFPIVWRKSHLRYVAGIFSIYQAGVLAIARSDSVFEIWDILHRSKSPSRIIRLSGNVFTDMFSDTLKLHTRKSTFCTTDILGSLKIYTYPKEYTLYKEESFQRANFIIQRNIKRRDKFKKWLATWRATHMKQIHEIPRKEKEEREHADLSEQHEETRDIETKKKRKSEMWREEEQDSIFISLAEKNNIKFSQIKRNRKQLNKVEAVEREGQDREDRLVAQEPELIETTQKMMLIETELKEHILPGFECLSPTVAEQMKTSFLNQYKDMEDVQKKYVKTHPYHYAFEWYDMIKDGVERRRLITLACTKENTHAKRYLMKKQNTDFAIEEEEHEGDSDSLQSASDTEAVNTD